MHGASVAGAPLAVADGAIVSTALMRDGAGPRDRLFWDLQKAQDFMEAACSH
jgi:predicted TIM-barrel enzyme